MCYIQHIYAANRMGASTFLISDLDNPAELAQIKSTPTDTELAAQIDESESKVRTPTCSTILPNAYDAYTYYFFGFGQVAKLREQLEPLRAGTPLVSPAELDALDAEWTKWRSEWVRRRKVFYKCAPPLALLPQERHHAPTNLTLFCF